ncbi:hypothetical protein T484DRAFT_2881500 [Baffinella frigidus]|nr:hypothetical protein T484DRAFT_2881500 [Cryptophyta sp. CCMP2293]
MNSLTLHPTKTTLYTLHPVHPAPCTLHPSPNILRQYLRDGQGVEDGVLESEDSAEPPPSVPNGQSMTTCQPLNHSLTQSPPHPLT